MANIEEARYQVLMSDDGKTLTLARYAVRNNQRNFVKIGLPPGATVWSASLSGKPAKPGQAADGSLLLPLEKARGGEDTPVFVVEILYISKATTWTDKGKVKLTLPALDLPVVADWASALLPASFPSYGGYRCISNRGLLCSVVGSF